MSKKVSLVLVESTLKMEKKNKLARNGQGGVVTEHWISVAEVTAGKVARHSSAESKFSAKAPTLEKVLSCAGGRSAAFPKWDAPENRIGQWRARRMSDAASRPTQPTGRVNE